VDGETVVVVVLQLSRAGVQTHPHADGHIVRLANACVDEVRRRVQQDTLGHRGRAGDPLYRIRKLLVMAAERLDTRGWQRLAVGLAAGDLDGQVTAAWQLKELVRSLFRADDIDQARRVLALIDAWAATIDAPECRRLVRTLHRWEDEILAFHTTGGITNARTEATIIWSRENSVVDVVDEAV
jgi:transposase